MEAAASRRRAELARPLSAAYAALPAVAAVALSGSTARASADRWSDVELMVFWTRAPSDEERRETAANGGASIQRLFPFDEDERIWGDDLSCGPVHVEVSHVLVATADEYLDGLLVRCDPDPLLLNFAQGILDAVPAHGADVLDAWKGRARVYPARLRHNVITRQAQIDHFWRWQMYVDRDNPILRASAAADVVGRLYATLLALNERYGPGLKSPDGLSQQFEIAPASFPERARRSMRVDPAEQAAILASLVGETYDLVEEHVPSVDVERLRRIFRFERTPST